MPDTAAAHAALTGIAAAAQQGPGDTLRIVLLVSMVGGALLAWFLLRGYGGGSTDGTADGTTDGTADGRTDEPADADGTPGRTGGETPDRPVGPSARGASGDAEDANA
ncbi:hypothetical protein ACFVU3_17175 [Streptomyces sp. NPDC058052]|uniref:hypothetical protein n=1 Tax=Streptomyces sp. NPDC058052 TaxID=3346316 RepID=UPI0036EC4DD3